MSRRKTNEVRVGKLGIGGNNPIWVQSMTTTDTDNIKATIAQAKALEEAGCELIRITVPDEKALKAIPEIIKEIKVPTIADVHFRQRIALGLMDTDIDKIRINPGNIGGPEKFREVIKKAKDKGKPIRIGVNSGSVEMDLIEKYGYPSVEAIVESALRGLEICEAEHFEQVIISLKSSNVQTAVECYRLFSKQSDYPIHLGITEAGRPGYGSLKSAVGLGALLLDGIGDTIRVSLTGDPCLEIPVAFDILKSSGVRITSPELISCPTCGRIDIDLDALTDQVEELLKEVKIPLKISLLGCAVNGPGEAREADIGIAGGQGKAILYKHGIQVKAVPEKELLPALKELIATFEKAELEDKG
jgi:(E)-4-hydroxy-3-methylbut-2-enyl-diphosphate synthase